MLTAAGAAAATGVRVFTATSSQGLLYGMEMLYTVAGWRAPFVLAIFAGAFLIFQVQPMVGKHIMDAIDASLAVMKENGLSIDAIEKITVHIFKAAYPLVLDPWEEKMNQQTDVQA